MICSDQKKRKNNIETELCFAVERVQRVKNMDGLKWRRHELKRP